MQKDRKTALLDPNPAPPRRCFRHWIHHRSAIIWTGGRPLGLSGTANSYSRWIRFRGAGQPTFEAFYRLLPQIRKTTPTLMRGRVSHGPMPATARSASLRCHRSRDTRPDRVLGGDLEAVFVLIGFRRFAQFSGNQCERAHSNDEKACG